MVNTVTLYLRHPAARRKTALRRLASALATIGPRGGPSVSELFGRVGDAAEFDLDQTAGYVRAVLTNDRPALPVTPTAERRSIHLHLGAGGGAARRDALDQLAGALGMSLSEMVNRLADATDADPERTAATMSEVMNLAAQSYVIAAEESARLAATRTTIGRYVIEREAKQAADKRASDVFVVRFADGSYDWFPAGGAVGYIQEGRHLLYDRDQYQVVSRFVAGRGWKATNR